MQNQHSSESQTVVTGVPYCDVNSSVLQLPELIEQIFLFAVKTDEAPPITPDALPSTLLRVCRRWRSVAIGTPVLWSEFTVSHGRFENDVWDEEYAKGRIATLENWLERSKEQPLSIVLEFGLDEDILGKLRTILIQHAFRITSTILPHASRWRNAIVQGPFFSLYKLIALLGPETPLLEKLHIDLSKSYIWDPQPVDVIRLDLSSNRSLTDFSFKDDGQSLDSVLIERIPSGLQGLRLNHAIIKSSTFYEMAPDIRTMDLEQVNLDEHFCVALQTCWPGLESLRIYKENDGVLALPEGQHICLSELQNLEVCCFAVNLIAQLSAPKLRNFSVFIDRADFITIAAPFLRRHPHITSLTLRFIEEGQGHIPLIEDDIIECLRQLKSLVLLKITGAPLTELILDALQTPFPEYMQSESDSSRSLEDRLNEFRKSCCTDADGTPYSSILCPHLTSITLQTSLSDHFNYVSVMTKILMSRLCPPSALQADIGDESERIRGLGATREEKSARLNKMLDERDEDALADASAAITEANICIKRFSIKWAGFATSIDMILAANIDEE